MMDTGMTGQRASNPTCRVPKWCAAALAAALWLSVSAPAQDAQAPGQSPPDAGTAPAGAAPAPAFKPGLIDQLGRWMDEGASRLKGGIAGAQESLHRLGGRAREVARDAAGTVAALPGTRAITAHQRCEPAPNGAPDCHAAAAVLCRGQGFQAGRLLDTQTERSCPARVLFSGRGESECRTEIFVTRAVCQ
jgi:hypothetical protein